MIRWNSSAVLAFALLWNVPYLQAQVATPDIRAVVEAAKKIEPGQDRTPFRILEESVRKSMAEPQRRPEIESVLIDLLGSDSGYEARAFACKHLGFIGTERSVPHLQRQVQDAKLAPAACTALANIKSPAAGKALRESLKTATGEVKPQVIVAIGTRRDERSMGALVSLASSDDARVASAAINALGKIGTSKSSRALYQLRQQADTLNKAQIDKALFACAEQMAREGQAAQAQEIFSDFMQPGRSPFLRRAAFASSMSLSKDKGLEMALTAMRGSDALFVPVAVEAARTIPGAEAARKFVEQLPMLQVDDQVALLDSLADRPEPEARASVTNALFSSTPALRRGAALALGRVGGPAEVRLFAQALASNPSPEEVKTLETVLIGLKGGRPTDEQILQALRKASGAPKSSLVKVLAARQGSQANKVLTEVASSGDAAASQAALSALSKTATVAEAPALLKLLVSSTSPAARTGARAACERALSMTGDPSVRFELLKPQFHPPPEDSGNLAELLSLLPVAGGKSALQTLEGHLNPGQAEVQEAAMDALSEWPDMDAWELLAGVYTNAPAPAARNQALRALVRLASDGNAKPDDGLINKYAQIIAGANGEGDYKLILGALGGCADPRALDMALEQLQRPGVEAEAAAAARRIADSIKKSHPEASNAALKRLSDAKKS